MRPGKEGEFGGMGGDIKMCLSVHQVRPDGQTIDPTDLRSHRGTDMYPGE